MVTSCFLNHIRHKLRGDRRPTLVFFILSRIREKWDDGCNSFSTGNFASMDHYAELHEGRINGTTPSVDDVYIKLPHGLCEGDI